MYVNLDLDKLLEGLNTRIFYPDDYSSMKLNANQISEFDPGFCCTKSSSKSHSNEVELEKPRVHKMSVK